MAKRRKLTQPLKIHGGKHYLAEKIIGLMPPRCKNPNKPADDDAGWLHYVEPYFGGGSVMLAMDPEGISEVANDINGDLSNFWLVLRSRGLFPTLERLLSATEFSKKVFDGCASSGPGHVERAFGFFVRCRQSLSGRMDAFTGITKQRTRRGMNAEVSAWLNCIDGLPEVHERLKRVLILSTTALDVIHKQDETRTLFYLDPPYLHETRATTGEYAYEMTEDEHGELLEVLGAPTFKGRFLLSGYHSDLYDDWAKACGWRCQEFKIDNKASNGKKKRQMTECVWMNY